MYTKYELNIYLRLAVMISSWHGNSVLVLVANKSHLSSIVTKDKLNISKIGEGGQLINWQALPCKNGHQRC